LAPVAAPSAKPLDEEKRGEEAPQGEASPVDARLTEALSAPPPPPARRRVWPIALGVTAGILVAGAVVTVAVVETLPSSEPFQTVSAR
jgi:uncharacterized protein involved in exopolysaccharide biosynthesis